MALIELVADVGRRERGWDRKKKRKEKEEGGLIGGVIHHFLPDMLEKEEEEVRYVALGGGLPDKSRVHFSGS